MRLARAAGPWWRIDPVHPREWTWEPFERPLHRFDPPIGRFRVRYAADHPVVAARERFPALTLLPEDGDLWLVRLDGRPSALHLTHQANLKALGLDDRINTGRLDLSRPGRDDPLLDTCGALSDAVHDWWDAEPPPIVYRSRTSPSHRNIAFVRSVAWSRVSAGRLRDATALHATLVLRHGFTVPESWLAG